MMEIPFGSLTYRSDLLEIAVFKNTTMIMWTEFLPVLCFAFLHMLLLVFKNLIS